MIKKNEMKHIIYSDIRKFLLFYFAITLFYSCSTDLEISPTHQISAELAFQDIDDVEAALASVYSGMRSSGYYGRNLSVLPDMMTDNLKESTESIAENRSVTDWLYISNDGILASTWNASYSIISDANIVLEQLERFENAENVKQANKIKGQALAVRGLVHFDLLRSYADQYERNSSELGVALATVSGLKDPFNQPARATVKECYDQIFKDLESALNLLNNVNSPVNTPKERNKIDAIGVQAILARVCLYSKSYDNAIKYASEVIKAKPLADDFDFPFMWEDNGVEEVAWSLFFGNGEGGRLAAPVFSQGTNRSQFDMAPDVVNLFGLNETERKKDIRYTSYVTPELPNASNQPRKGRHIATKYNKKSSSTVADGIVNFKAFRTGEMYLIRAESYFYTNNENAALQDLNKLRSTRIPGVNAGNESGDLLNIAIQTERRKELWLEGHRWFDLKRTDRTLKRNNCTPPATACELEKSSTKWNFPIPLSEMQANKNMKQNNGY